MVHVPTRGDAVPRFGPQFAEPPRRGALVDANLYRDPDRFERERTTVLRTSWLLGAHASEMANIGDWTLYEGHGETIVMSRQPDGSVAAFHNVCQHRGARLTRGETSGCDRRFTCPWHGWVYDQTGDLVGVPERDRFEPHFLDGVRAPKVAAAEWGGFIWINLAGDDAPSFADWIGPDIMSDLGRFAVDQMVVLAKVVYDIPANYKAIIDGFNEVYHATELHHTSREFTVSARDTTFHFTGPHSMMFVPRPEFREQLAVDSDQHKHAICHYVLFPNTVFNNNPRHIQIFQPIPMAVDRCRFILWELIYPSDGSDAAEYADYLEKTMAHWEVLKGVIEEDVFIFNELDATRHSAAYTRNLFGAHECKPVEYHATMQHVVDGGSAMDRWNDHPGLCS
jgi:phenylpropionate dioxygenase-like ring-hydroxylating dioxygenase large terminal subunit